MMNRKIQICIGSTVLFAMLSFSVFGQSQEQQADSQTTTTQSQDTYDKITNLQYALLRSGKFTRQELKDIYDEASVLAPNFPTKAGISTTEEFRVKFKAWKKSYSKEYRMYVKFLTEKINQ